MKVDSVLGKSASRGKKLTTRSNAGNTRVKIDGIEESQQHLGKSQQHGQHRQHQGKSGQHGQTLVAPW